MHVFEWQHTPEFWTVSWWHAGTYHPILFSDHATLALTERWVIEVKKRAQSRNIFCVCVCVYSVLCSIPHGVGEIGQRERDREKKRGSLLKFAVNKCSRLTDSSSRIYWANLIHLVEGHDPFLLLLIHAGFRVAALSRGECIWVRISFFIYRQTHTHTACLYLGNILTDRLASLYCCTILLAISCFVVVSQGARTPMNTTQNRQRWANCSWTWPSCSDCCPDQYMV